MADVGIMDKKYAWNIIYVRIYVIYADLIANEL